MTLIKRILVPVDFSDCSKQALEYALELQDQLRAELVVLHVWHIPPLVEGELIIQPAGASQMSVSNWMELEAARSMEQFIKPLKSARLTTKLKEGLPSETIHKFAQEENIDVIVMGTQGRTGLKRWMMGSVAERVIRTSSCPVLTVRRKETPQAPDKHPSK